MFVKGAESAYERALERAQAEHLQLIDEGEDSRGRYFYVRNPKYVEGFYTVRWASGAHTLSCNCEAGNRGALCKHRAYVRAELVFRKLLDEAVAMAQAIPFEATIW